MSFINEEVDSLLYDEYWKENESNILLTLQQKKRLEERKLIEESDNKITEDLFSNTNTNTFIPVKKIINSEKIEIKLKNKDKIATKELFIKKNKKPNQTKQKQSEIFELEEDYCDIEDKYIGII